MANTIMKVGKNSAWCALERGIKRHFKRAWNRKVRRNKEFMTKEGRQKAFEQCQKLGIDALVCIGGDGSFTGAKIFNEEFGIKVINIRPGAFKTSMQSKITSQFDQQVEFTKLFKKRLIIPFVPPLAIAMDHPF